MTVGAVIPRTTVSFWLFCRNDQATAAAKVLGAAPLPTINRPSGSTVRVTGFFTQEVPDRTLAEVISLDIADLFRPDTTSTSSAA